MSRPASKIGAVAPWNGKGLQIEPPPPPPKGEPKKVSDIFDIGADVFEFFWEVQTQDGEDINLLAEPDWPLLQVRTKALPNIRRGLAAAVKSGAMSKSAAARLAANIVSSLDLAVRASAGIDWKHHKELRAVVAVKDKKKAAAGRVKQARETAHNGWQKDALKRADDLRKSHPDWKPSELARQIRKAWDKTELTFKPVSERHLYLFLLDPKKVVRSAG